MLKSLKTKLVLALGLLTMALSGCGDTNNNTTNPNPNAFTPKGTVTGVLVDSVTRAPIAGADVYVMDRHAVTGEQGQFTIFDVPANTAVGTETGTAQNDSYELVIDMKNVNAAITAFNNNAANTTKKAFYPNIAYQSVKVSYTSLGETSQQTGNTNATNHDTPVNGFVATVEPQIGKLDTFLKIQVVKASDLSVVSGATVELFGNNAGALNNNPTGNGHLVATATTDATGIASFGPIEAQTNFSARATSSDAKLQGFKNVATEVDGITTSYLVQGVNNALTIATVDGVQPFLVSSSPANLADLAIPATGTLDIAFTFSEAIKSSNYANAVSADLAANGGLYNDVTVNYNGPKIGNIAHSMAWSTDRTKLTVSIPVASLTAASKYTVSINAALAAGKLQDANNNNFTGVVGTTGVVNFTTAGSLNVAAPVITQSATSATVVDWPHVANAVDYSVTVEKLINGAVDTTATYATGGANTFNLAAAGIYAGFDSGAITYTVKVKAVNTAGSLSAASNVVTMSDTLLAAPTVALPDLTKGAPFNFTWLPVTNATDYEYAVEPVIAGIGQGYGAPVSAGGVSQATVAVGAFVTGEQKITYNVKFRSVNNNNTKGPWGAPLTIEDKVGPSIAAFANGTSFLPIVGTNTLAALDAANLNGASKTFDYTFTVTFNDQMVKSAVQTAANWAVSKGTATNGGLFVAGAADVLPTVKSVAYNPATLTATVTITYTNDATNTATTDPGHTVFTFTGTDLNGNAIKATADAVDFAVGIF